MAGTYAPCQALRRDGGSCWAPAMLEQRIQGLSLCWMHTARLLLVTQGMPKWAQVKAAERRGQLRFNYDEGQFPTPLRAAR